MSFLSNIGNLFKEGYNRISGFASEIPNIAKTNIKYNVTPTLNNLAQFDTQNKERQVGMLANVLASTYNNAPTKVYQYPEERNQPVLNFPISAESWNRTIQQKQINDLANVGLGPKKTIAPQSDINNTLYRPSVYNASTPQGPAYVDAQGNIKYASSDYSSTPWYARPNSAGDVTPYNFTGQTIVGPQGSKSVIQRGDKLYLDASGQYGGEYTPTSGGGGTPTATGGGASPSRMGVSGVIAPAATAGVNTLSYPQSETNTGKDINIKTKQVKLPKIVGNANQAISLGNNVAERYKQLIQKATSPEVKQTYQGFLNTINQVVDTQKELINQQNPTPDTPLINEKLLFPELPKIPDFVKVSEDLQTQLGIPAINQKIIDTEKELQAINDTFSQITKDIQDNPNLPKSLALRRIKDAQNSLGQRQTALQGQLNILGQQRQMKLDEYKNKIGLMEQQYNLQNQQARDARTQATNELNRLISTGALAEFSPDEITQLSQQLGMDEKQLTKIADTIRKKSSKYDSVSTRVDENGNLNVIGTKKDGTAKIIKKYSGFGGSTSQSTIDASNYDKAKLEAGQHFAQFINERIQQAQQTGEFYDGLLDPAIYKAYRDRVPVKYRDNFDKTFSDLLSNDAKGQIGLPTDNVSIKDMIYMIGQAKADGQNSKAIDKMIAYYGYDPNDVRFKDVK